MSRYRIKEEYKNAFKEKYHSLDFYTADGVFYCIPNPSEDLTQDHKQYFGRNTDETFEKVEERIELTLNASNGRGWVEKEDHSTFSDDELIIMGRAINNELVDIESLHAEYNEYNEYHVKTEAAPPYTKPANFETWLSKQNLI